MLANTGAIISAEIVGGSSDPAVIGANHNWVGRITDTETESVKITAMIDGAAISRTYDLSELVLETE